MWSSPTIMDCWKEKGSCHIHSPKQQPKCFPLFLANLSFQIYNQTFKIIKQIYFIHLELESIMNSIKRFELLLA